MIAKGKKKVVNVLFGGATSERQVSLMSGTNVIFKLKRSKKYEPVPFLLDQNNMVWELPYSFILSHTVEEIVENIHGATKIKNKVEPFKRQIYKSLKVSKSDAHEAFFLPRKFSLSTFIKKSKFIFIGLHGGFGEDGTLQKMLEKAHVKFNGPTSKVSEVCMNKFHTGEKIRKLQIPGIYTASQAIIQMADTTDINQLWKSLLRKLEAKTVIAKPIADGCSTGIVRLFSKNDLEKYVSLLESDTRISANTFKNQKEIVELPNEKTNEILFENFIETDKVSIKGTQINYEEKTGWIEITVGVVTMNDKLVVMNPSITIADGEVLSVEEKFQGGTGVNITPPPTEIIPTRILQIIKKRIGLVANEIGITGYSRIDAFVNKNNGDVSIIEINTLPGLTPSTVIFHQALSEKEPIFPTQFIELLIKNKKY